MRGQKVTIDIKKVEELASRGLTLEEIALSMGFSYDTLNRRKQELQELRDALKRGQLNAQIHVVNKLMDKIDKEDTTAIIFYLKCHGWSEKDKTEVQISGEVTQKVYQYGWAAAAGVPETGIKDNDK